MFGLVNETAQLPAYETTFRNMSVHMASDRAGDSGITDKVSRPLRNSEAYDFAFLPLGSDYVDALEFESIPEAVPAVTTAVVFNQKTATADHDSVVSLSAWTTETKAHSIITVALKGKYLAHFATRVGGMPPSPNKLVTLCTRTDSTQVGFNDF